MNAEVVQMLQRDVARLTRELAEAVAAKAKAERERDEASEGELKALARAGEAEALLEHLGKCFAVAPHKAVPRALSRIATAERAQREAAEAVDRLMAREGELEADIEAAEDAHRRHIVEAERTHEECRQRAREAEAAIKRLARHKTLAVEALTHLALGLGVPPGCTDWQDMMTAGLRLHDDLKAEAERLRPLWEAVVSAAPSLDARIAWCRRLAQEQGENCVWFQGIAAALDASGEAT